MNDKTKEKLFQTYPKYIGKKYVLTWDYKDDITLISSLGDTISLKYSYSELATIIQPDLAIEDALDCFVYAYVPLDAVEAGNNGSLVYSVATHTWQVGSMRPNGDMKYAYWSSFSSIEQRFIGEKWAERFTADDFSVSQEDLLVEIKSTTLGIAAAHCLQSKETMAKLMENCYDLSPETEILLTDDYTSIIVGHKQAIERLYIPGYNSYRKSFQDIHHEVWSNNAV